VSGRYSENPEKCLSPGLWERKENIMQVERLDTWAASLEDKPGSLASKLEALSKAGANLEFVVARRTPEKGSGGVVFTSPITGAAMQAAKAAGFEKSETMHTLRIEGADKPGEGARMTLALAKEGINLRGLSGAAVGGKLVGYLALDSEEDAKKAMGVLKKL
jgi:hypothetical protein